MRGKLINLLCGLVLLGLGGIANSTTITITELVGDIDCFGLGAPCSDGVAISGINFGADGDALVDPSDPLGTDQLGTSVPLGGPSFDFLFDVAVFDLLGVTPTYAQITIFTAGIELVGATFFFNGVDIGFYTEPDGQENIAATVVLEVPIDLLSNENSLFFSVPDLGLVQDGFVVDYIELLVVGAASVPEPSTLGLLGIGLFGLAMARRRRKV